MKDKYYPAKIVAASLHSIGGVNLAVSLFAYSTGDYDAAKLMAICSVGVHTGTYVASELERVCINIKELRDFLQDRVGEKKSLETIS